MIFQWLHLIIYLFIMLVINSFCHVILTSFRKSWLCTIIEIENACELLSTFTHFSSMGLDFFVHVFCIRLFFDSTHYIWSSTENMWFILGLFNLLSLWGFSIEFLLESFLILNFFNKLITANLNFFQDICLKSFSLNLNSFIHHLTELIISLLKFSVFFNQCLISRSIRFVLVF